MHHGNEALPSVPASQKPASQVDVSHEEQRVPDLALAAKQARAAQCSTFTAPGVQQHHEPLQASGAQPGASSRALSFNGMQVRACIDCGVIVPTTEGVSNAGVEACS